MPSPAPILPKTVLIRSLKVGAVVGTILNLINQPEAIFGDAPLVLWKVLLTYSVPFLVATYGAVTALSAHNKDAHPKD
ncbi:MAG: nitrate/nitrite transporter NrtS [Pseudomonadota bacterium]